MSYASISTRNVIGVKKIPVSGQFRFLRGLGSLGQDVSQSDLESAGVDPGIATTLLALGATDSQLEAVINDPDSADAAIALLQQLSGSSPEQAVQSSTPSTLAQQSLAQTGYDLTDPASWYDITGQLQQANEQIKTLEALVQQQPQQYGAAIGTQVIALRNEYTDLANKWITVYMTAMGSQPTGLSGYRVGLSGRLKPMGALGVAPIIIAAAIIAAAGIVIAGLVVLNDHINSATTIAQSTSQAQQAASATQQSLLNQYNQTMQAAQAAAAAGQTSLAQQYAQNAAALAAQLSSTGYKLPGSTSGTLAAWFTANWYWVAAVAVLAIVGPPLIKKL